MTNPTPPSSPTEIERKFLVTSDTWREAIKKSTRIEQGYLSADRERAVRVRVRTPCAGACRRRARVRAGAWRAAGGARGRAR